MSSSLHTRNESNFRNVNRQYKDSLFRFIFKDRKALLELYNAINGSDYPDPGALEFTTLEDVIYVGMKNDLSFVIGSVLNLYEHQSTWNENMPLRGLFYFSELYKKHLDTMRIVISETRRRVMVPFPQYIVFYNGTTDVQDKWELLLSDSFENTGRKATPALECRATVLNINYGHNKKIMEQCRTLSDYSAFIAEVRKRLSDGLPIGTAVDKSIDTCISNGILEEVLTMCRNECRNSILTEYNEERHWATIRKEATEDGLAIGIEQGIQQGIQQGQSEGIARVNRLNLLLSEQKRYEDIARASSDKDYQLKLFEEYNI